MGREKSRRVRRSNRRKRPEGAGHGPGDGYADLSKLVGEVIGRIFAPPQIIREYIEVSIPDEMFRKLLMLCHPDKHGNSELSAEVTRWLIEQRDLKK